jgi:hypothetical protein
MSRELEVIPCTVVILSEAKDLLFKPGQQILRFAQDDNGTRDEQSS